MIATAAERIGREEAPFLQAWQESRKAADTALLRDYVAYTGSNMGQYWRAGREHGFASRHLTLAHQLTGDSRYGEKARDILLAWARAMQVNPNPAGANQSGQGLVLGRVLSIFCDTYAMLYPDLSADDREEIQGWLRAIVPLIQGSQRIWIEEHQRMTNHVGAQNMGMASIGFVLDDRKLLQHVLYSPRNPYNQLEVMTRLILMPGDEPDAHRRQFDPSYTKGAPKPLPGEIYDRFRHFQGNGRHYALLSLRFLTLVAEAAQNNFHDKGKRHDLYGWVGRNGENLELPYDVYADFFITGEAASANNAYFVGESVTYSEMPMYEIAHRRYPDNNRIRAALEAHFRAVLDNQTFGWTAVLTHGLADVAPAPEPEPNPGLGITEWDFNIDGDFEGWTLRKYLQGEVAGGSFNLTVSGGSDPGIMSPAGLGLAAADYRYLKIRMRNQSAGASGRLYFVTDDHTSFGASVVGIPLQSNDDKYREYVIDCGDHDHWQGLVQQIRIDPVEGVSQGQVSIDYIRFAAAAG